jgi:RNA polymerase primary sigma factor
MAKKNRTRTVAAKPVNRLGREEKNSKMKELIRLAKEQGYLTYSDVNDLLPDSIISAEELDSILIMLRGMDIEIIDASEVDRFKQEAAAEEKEQEKEPPKIDSRLDILDDPVRMYLKQMGQVPLLTREQEVEISKRIEDAEIHVKRIINNFGFTAKEHLHLAKRLSNGKERFDRVIIDKKIDSREQYMKVLPRLVTQVTKTDAIVDARYEKLNRSGLTKREQDKLAREFKKADTGLQKLFDKFYFKQKVLEEFVERANDMRERFDADLNELDRFKRLRQSAANTTEIRNVERKIKRLELAVRMTTTDFIKIHDELKTWMKRGVQAKT